MSDALTRGKINLVLSTLAFVISSAGSVLLHIVFATTIYRTTGSSLLTSAFLSLQWLPVLVVILFKSDWEDGVDPRRRWIRLDVLSALLTLPVLFFVDKPNYLVLFLLLFARGIVDHVTRIIKTVSARYIFPKEKSALYASILQAGYHIGIGLAAVAGMLFSGRFSLATVTLIDIASFLTAAFLMLFVKTINAVEDEKKTPQASLKKRARTYIATLQADPKLFFCAMLAPLSATFFQGTYSAFQPTFPIKVLQLDASAVTIAYVLSSLSVIGGSSLFAFLSKRWDFYKGDFARTKTIIFGLSVLSAVSYLVSVATNHVGLSAAAFVVMVIAFEMIYMFGYAGIVAYAPKGELGSVFGIGFCIGCSAASLCVVAAGALLDYMGGNFLAVAAFFMTGYLLFLWGGHLVSSRMGAKARAAAYQQSIV